MRKVVVGLSFVGAIGVITREVLREPRYNLLVIQTDEHNFRTLGCYRELLPPEQALMWGPAVVETPFIDSIAQRGAIATSFYATTPVCSPSRAAFVSGCYPHTTTVVANNVPLADGIVTFAEVLRRRGYATGYAGKWHLDGDGSPQWAPERKFGFEDNRYMFNKGHWKQIEETPDGPRVATRNHNGRPTHSLKGVTEKTYTTDFLTDRALEFVRANRERPFCYYLSYPDPHGPDSVRAPYDALFRGLPYERARTHDLEGRAVPHWGRPSADKDDLDLAAYYGMVKCIDDNVGRILAELRSLGIQDRTIVVFTADHGDLLGEHNRRDKGVPYEGSARIPFLIACPGRIPPGTVVEEALSCVDFLPSVLSLMGVETAGGEEGRDASVLLAGQAAPEGWEDVAIIRSWDTRNGDRWIAAVTDRYKLVLSTSDPPWLFDLELDPDEFTNVFSVEEHGGVVRRLARALVDHSLRTNDPFVELPNIREGLDRATCR